MINQNFWKGKKVFVTGHTGFKGSWLCLWLHSLGANITGYSLDPPTSPSLFEQCKINEITKTITGDIRDYKFLSTMMANSDPDIIFHLAAQPLVRKSYSNPIETYETNVLGTVNVLEAVRELSVNSIKKRALVNVTSDKCYENKEWLWGYREHDALGGFDPYSNSKACSELVTSCYVNSFFNPNKYSTHHLAIASARAGNVIGGGDWAKDRLIPDCMQSLLKGGTIKIRNPKSIRPWQHVLEPLSGYLLLAQKLCENGVRYSQSWNFGPNSDSEKTVEWIVNELCNKWGICASYSIAKDDDLHEARMLKLDCSKAKDLLGWNPRWTVDQAIEKVVEWGKAFQKNIDIKEVCLKQINEYSNSLINL
jgi:CDP-glucose 4,6-dehydratase